MKFTGLNFVCSRYEENTAIDLVKLFVYSEVTANGKQADAVK